MKNETLAKLQELVARAVTRLPHLALTADGSFLVVNDGTAEPLSRVELMEDIVAARADLIMIQRELDNVRPRRVRKKDGGDN